MLASRWLKAAKEPCATDGGFYGYRRERSEHAKVSRPWRRKRTSEEASKKTRARREGRKEMRAHLSAPAFVLRLSVHSIASGCSCIV